MQLYVINWTFQNPEDQLFATNEFCNYVQAGKLNETINGFELKFIAHIPQNGSGVIICESDNTHILFKLLKMWRENFNVSFDIKPAQTNEELLLAQSDKSFWVKS